MVIDSIEVRGLISAAEDIALFGVELHAPLLGPFLKVIKVLLELLVVCRSIDGSVE